TIVFATVKGDIHDIGKNICILMLRNFGFRVIDLGKNVPGGLIIEEAVKNRAHIMALSALMTTTMTQMGNVIDEVRRKKLPLKVMVGGAVLTGRYADEMGADGYARDVGELVKVAENLLSDN
ncbi:MAG: cobalamin-dependent protein, partial [Fidelibacterota bacterium]